MPAPRPSPKGGAKRGAGGFAAPPAGSWVGDRKPTHWTLHPFRTFLYQPLSETAVTMLDPLDIQEHSDSAVPSGLSPRQQQILALLKAGKVNKEIANELGIGLGTVKQHVVALFKKLNVSNRTMAVAQGLNLQTEPPALMDSVLERRPCVVLSIRLPTPAQPEHLGELYKTLSSLAAEQHALLLERRETAAADLIFGIQRVTEQDIFKALRAAHTVYAALSRLPEQSPVLQGGLTAGLAIVSMHRRGGWSGEAVVSAVISKARALVAEACPGILLLGQPAIDLLDALGSSAPGCAPAALAFSTLERMPWGRGMGRETPLTGRAAELASLEALLEDSRLAADSSPKAASGNPLVYIEGETGMGKSRLCRHLAERNTELGGHSHHFVCQPGGDKGDFYIFPSGAPVQWPALLHCMKSASGRTHELVIVDDCHLLPAAVLTKLAEAGARCKGKLILLTARKFAAGLPEPCQRLKLGRISHAEVASLVAALHHRSHAPRENAVLDVRPVLPAPLQTIQADADATRSVAGCIPTPSVGTISEEALPSRIAELAAGVPLFAVELARHAAADAIPLSLQVVIGARMDGLPLDRAVLRQAAKTAAPCSAEQIADALQELPASVGAAVEQAIAAGVLKRDDDGGLHFVHPLLRQVIHQAGVE
ncbi:MAG: hypothetical protein EPN21_20455 [Methylococcaceae bacterium]|nr:MAG: hypothetical protein EPN21_20455 [Methylococcaceae bacterium]